MPAATIQMTIQANAKKKAAQEAYYADNPDRKRSLDAKAFAKKQREAAEQKRREEEAEEYEKKNPIKAFVGNVLDFLGSLPVQTILFMTFVFVFQSLADTMRQREEYYLDKHVMDRLVDNHFDSSHNTFNSMRRIADVYEWGNTVLIPGLMGGAGPTAVRTRCEEGVETEGEDARHVVAFHD